MLNSLRNRIDSFLWVVTILFLLLLVSGALQSLKTYGCSWDCSTTRGISMRGLFPERASVSGGLRIETLVNRGG